MHSCASTILSSLPRRATSARPTPFSWFTASHPWTCVQTKIKCQLWLSWSCPAIRSSFAFAWVACGTTERSCEMCLNGFTQSFPSSNGGKLLSSPAMEVIVRGLLAELSAPPVLVLSDWDAVEGGSRPCRVYCDDVIDSFGTTLE